MKKLLLSFSLLSIITSTYAQSGHDIRINFKNCKDSVMYLAFYQFDKSYLADTCKKVVKGNIVFKGPKTLEKGIYYLVSQDKARYFDFFISDNNQKMTMSTDTADLVKNLKCVTHKENDDFFTYIKFITAKNKEYADVKSKTKGMNAKDSAAFMMEKGKVLNETVIAYENAFLESHKGTFVGDVINLKMEKEAKDIPKASNGRPDSMYIYNYYKNHYWDGVNLQDDGIMRTPFFSDRLKKYFNNVIVQHPDTMSAEIDRFMAKTKAGTMMQKLLIAHFLFTSESSKLMGFDKVFVHVIDKYIRTGMAKEVYDEATIAKIKERGDILKPLLLGSQAPDLLMIDTIGHKQIAKMGFDTVKTSAGATKLYYDNAQNLAQLFVPLYGVKADYIMLVFWDVDCGHCKTEIPKLIEEYHTLKKEGYDIKVFSVYTQQEYEKYRKYIIENKLDWINVYDGVHINNIKEKYDIYSTPVIYMLDRNKRIKAKRIGTEQVKDIVKQMEKEYNNGSTIKNNPNTINIDLGKIAEEKEKQIKERLATITESLNADNAISENVITEVKANVVEEIGPTGKKESNLQVEFVYEVVKVNIEQKTDDYPLGGYKLASSNAAKVTAQLLKQAMESELKQYLTPGTRVSIKITGTTDGTAISNGIPYFGEYGEFREDLYYSNNELKTTTILKNSNIKSNSQLAFLRTQGIRDFMETYIEPLKSTENTFQHFAVVKSEKGSQYRKIQVEITIHDAFNENKNVKNTDNDLTKLYLKCKKPVFLVNTSDDIDEFQGSGFFINSTGVAVSNYHVFEGTYLTNARIYTEDGKTYEVEKVIEANKEKDYIKFKVKNPNNIKFPFLNIAFLEPNVGEKVFAIGNPQGLTQTLSEGIISGFRNGKKVIQTTTPITHGSSGGPLFNMRGEVVGITTGSFNRAASDVKDANGDVIGKTDNSGEGSLFRVINIMNLKLNGEK